MQDERVVAGDDNTGNDPEDEAYATHEAVVFVAFEYGRTGDSDCDGGGDVDGNGEMVVELSSKSKSVVAVEVGITVGI